MFSALAVLTYCLVVAAQSELLFPVGFQNNELSGSAIGTGLDGTTYELQGLTQSIPFTLTLVQAADRISETAGIAALSLTVDVVCTNSGSVAFCEDVVNGPTATTTITTSGPYVLTPVPIGEQTGAPTTATSPSSVSTLPPSLSSPSSSPSSARPTSAPSSSPSQTPSSASRISIPGALCSLVLSAALVALF